MTSRPTPPSIGGSSSSYSRPSSSYSSRPTPPSVGGSSYSRPSSSYSSRPTPPSTDNYRPSPTSRPTPPSVNPSYSYRPTPPAVNHSYTRPTPPSTHRYDYSYYEPVVPRYYPYPLRTFPSQYASFTRLPFANEPREIEYNFLNAVRRLKDEYNNTPMTRSEYSALERNLVSQAVDQLMIDARYSSRYERETALRSIYNNSEMTYSEFNRILRDMTY